MPPAAPSLEEALAWHRAGRLSEAGVAYRAILQTDPRHVDALHFLGVIAYQEGRYEEALELIASALAVNPDNPPAHNNLGNVHAARGETEAAIVCYRNAIARDPGYLDALTNLGARLRERRELDEAVDCYQRALALAPDSASIHTGLAAAYSDRGEPERAIELARRAVTLDPGLAEGHNNLGIALQMLGDPVAAAASYERALALNSTLPAARLNLAYATLLLGDYGRGLELMESRLEKGALPALYSGIRVQAEELAGVPRWRGEPLRGKSLLVWTEQGLGDSIMMLRYLPLLEGNGAKRLIARCEPPLLRLFEHAAGAWSVVPRDAPLVHEEIDLHCPMMSLPYVFALRGNAIARNVPYISVPDALGRIWRNQLGEVVGLRVGLAWAGGAAFVGGAQRDISLERLAPLFDVTGVRLVSLQKGPASAEIERSRLRLIDRMRDCRDLLDTAALIDRLDLVISVDTAVAHLAGALGKPVWLLNRLDSDWRWMREREDSPWYPTMRIFRQARRGEWDGVIRGAAAALRRLAESRPSG